MTIKSHQDIWALIKTDAEAGVSYETIARELEKAGYTMEHGKPITAGILSNIAIQNGVRRKSRPSAEVRVGEVAKRAIDARIDALRSILALPFPAEKIVALMRTVLEEPS